MDEAFLQRLVDGIQESAIYEKLDPLSTTLFVTIGDGEKGYFRIIYTEGEPWSFTIVIWDAQEQEKADKLLDYVEKNYPELCAEGVMDVYQM